MRTNRGCTAYIDNDSWYIIAALPDNWDEMGDEKQDDWLEGEGTIAKSRDFPDLECTYGFGILEALAHAVGHITLEPV